MFVVVVVGVLWILVFHELPWTILDSSRNNGSDVGLRRKMMLMVCAVGTVGESAHVSV